MEGQGIYCFRRSSFSESDNVIEGLKFEGMSGSPKLAKLEICVPLECFQLQALIRKHA